MLRVAILGANGFIGSRAVEFFHLAGLAEVRPIVRHPARLARVARFDLDCRVADGFDCAALKSAFAGCDVVVHAVAGDPRTIRGTVRPAYEAAQRVGVRRFVYLSTASVHGQAPAPGTDERTRLRRRQPLPYNRAKIDAERRLARLRRGNNVEIVILRPGIVFGPRSPWVTTFVDALLAGEAYMVNGGRGICNTVYVDNVAHAIHLAMITPGIDGEAFLIGDEETITWADFYGTLARALGRDFDRVHNLPPFIPTVKDRLAGVVLARAMHRRAQLLPGRAKRALSQALCSLKGTAAAAPVWDTLSSPVPQATLEMSLLHQCSHKLSWSKAEQALGYKPIISFAEGCRRTIAWLEFAGYAIDRCRAKESRSGSD